VLNAHRSQVKVWQLERLHLGYVPVPKVASSSIREMMRTMQADWMSAAGAVNNREVVDEQIRFSLRPKQVLQLREQYYLFSFVRNPLMRLYSCYRDKVVNAEQRRKRCTFSPYRIHFGMSFEDFIERIAQIPDRYSDQHFRSQTGLLYHKGELLVNYVGKLEQFADDWEQVSARYEFPELSRSKRVSGAALAMHELPITRRGLSIVMDRFAEDLDHFEYRQDLEALMDELPA